MDGKSVLTPRRPTWQKAYVFPLLLVGAGGITAQTFLLREFLVLFSGNEFSVGLVIGTWIVAEALGAFIGGRLTRGSAAVRYVALATLFAFAFPAAVFATRGWKSLAGLPPDVGMGVGQIFLAATAVMALPGIVHGALFVASAALARAEGTSLDTGAGRAYLLDAAGTVAGGLVAGFLLVPRLSSFHAAALLLVATAAAAFRLRAACPGGRGFGTAAIILCLGAGATGLAGGAAALHERALRLQWQGKELLASRNSPYQNIAVIRTGEQFTFYTDGLPEITVPDPDIAAVEDFVHIPLLAHSGPRRILVLGRGAGGVLTELLKYESIERIDYVELDPEILRAIADFPAPLTRRELADPRVRTIHQDGRLFLRETPTTYDVILVGAMLPHTLEENRFASREFFAALRAGLNPGGIAALTTEGTLTYYGPELRDVTASLVATLRQVFPQVLVLPAETNLFLLGEEPIPGAEILAARQGERRLETSSITPDYLAYRFDPELRSRFEEQMQGGNTQVNRDFRPTLLFRNLAYQSIQFSPWLRRPLETLSHLRFPLAAALVAGVVAVAALVVYFRRRLLVPWVIGATGFAGMTLELALICAFQVFHGAMYQAVGILITAFMGGLAAGTFYALTRSGRGRERQDLLAAVSGLVLAALLVAALTVFGPALGGGWTVAYGIVVLLLVASGGLTGFAFIPALRLQERISARGGERTVGSVYGADLLGGWLAGIVAGIVLLPVLGIPFTCLLLALLQTGVWIVLYLFGRET